MIQFTDDCRIQIEHLDAEHEYLFNILNRIIDVLEYDGSGDNYDEIKNLINELNDYANSHFDHEEEYMVKICDPEIHTQRIQHNAFRNYIERIEFRNIDNSDEQKIVLKEMVNYLFKWLYNHIIASDLMIGKMPSLEEWKMKEHPCEFTDDYLINVPLIDGEHEELFKIISQVNEIVRLGVEQSDSDEINEVISRLRNYTVEHFKDEEEYMESINFPELDVQKRAHSAFLSKIDTLDMNEIMSNPQENMEHLVEFLTQWLITHILHMDMKIGKYKI